MCSVKTLAPNAPLELAQSLEILDFSQRFCGQCVPRSLVLCKFESSATLGTEHSFTLER